MTSPKFAGNAESFAPQFGTVESTRDGPAKVCESGSSPLVSRFDSGGRMDCNITFLHFYAGVVQR